MLWASFFLLNMGLNVFLVKTRSWAWWWWSSETMSPISHPQLTRYIHEHDGDHHLKLCHPAHISNQVCSRGRSRLPNSRPFEDPGSGQEPSPGQLRRDLRCAHLRSKLFEPAGCHGCVPAGGPGQPGQVIVIMRMMWLRIKMRIRMIIILCD